MNQDSGLILDAPALNNLRLSGDECGAYLEKFTAPTDAQAYLYLYN